MNKKDRKHKVNNIVREQHFIQYIYERKAKNSQKKYS